MEESGSDKVCENFDKPDILAISTQYTRKFCNRIQSVANQFQRSTCYKWVWLMWFFWGERDESAFLKFDFEMGQLIFAGWKFSFFFIKYWMKIFLNFLGNLTWNLKRKFK